MEESLYPAPISCDNVKRVALDQAFRTFNYDQFPIPAAVIVAKAKVFERYLNGEEVEFEPDVNPA